MELSYRVQTCPNNRGSVFESEHSGVWSQQFEPELCNSRYCGWNHLAWFRLWVSRCRIDLCTCRHVTAPTWKPNAATTQDKHMTKTSKEANHGNINRDPSHNPSLYKIDNMPLTYVNVPYVNVTQMKIMKARQHPTVRDKLQKEAIAITSWSREPSMASKLPFGKPSTAEVFISSYTPYATQAVKTVHSHSCRTLTPTWAHELDHLWLRVGSDHIISWWWSYIWAREVYAR